MGRLTVAFGAAVAGVLLAGTAPPPPATTPFSTTLPPYVQTYEPTTVDERGLWMEADEQERTLRDSALVMHEDDLNRYVKGVLCKAVGQERCRSVRVYVLEVPQFNASMSPNGTMRVWSGLLLRVQNEAELAAILGHEFAHFELRHGLRAFKQARSSTDVAAWVGLLGAAAGVSPAALQMSVIGGIYRFSRDQEAAADMLSLGYMANSPYPNAAAADVWRYVMGEDDARSISRGLKPKQAYSSGFFDTHPASLARATYLQEEAMRQPHPGDYGAKAYRDAMRPYLARFLAAQVKANDFGGSEYLLQKMSGVEGWTGDLLFARGQLYRSRGNPRDLATASQFFREAITQGYTEPVVYRELGLSLMRNGEQADGRTALQEYLTRSPDASDRGMINALVATK